MVNSQQIMSLHPERLSSMSRKEEKEAKGPLLPASRESKRDVTPNPVRKAKLNLLLAGHSHTDLTGWAYK